MKGLVEQVVKEHLQVVLTVRIFRPYFDTDTSHIITEEEREQYDKRALQYGKQIKEFERLRLGEIGFGYCD